MADNQDILSDDELAVYEVPNPAVAAAVAAVPPPAAQPEAPASDVLSDDEIEAYGIANTPAQAAPVPAPVEPAPVEEPATEPAGVTMVAPDNSIVVIHPDDVEPAVRLKGYQLLTPELQHDLDLQETHGGFGGKVVTSLEGIGRGASLGISDYAARVASGIAGAIPTPNEILEGERTPIVEGGGIDAQLASRGIYNEQAADSAARDIKEYQEANPITAGLSEAGGAIAAAVASGGTSQAATLARMTPAGRLASLGGRLGEFLGQGATKAGLGAVGRVAGIGAAAGLEGGVDNAARSVMADITQSGLDPAAMGRTAERMVDAFWDGLKYGAIFGTGVGAVAEGLGRLGKKSADLAEDAVTSTIDAPSAPRPPLVPGGPQTVLRPTGDIANDIKAAKAKLDEAMAAGLHNNADEAENQVAKLLNEQDDAVLAAEGITDDATIDAKLILEPSPEVRGIIERVDAYLNTAKNAQDLEIKFKDAASELEQGLTKDLDDLSRFKTNIFDTYTNRSKNPMVVKDMLAKEGITWGPEVASKWMGRLDELESSFDDVLDGTKQTSFSKMETGAAKAGKESLAKIRTYLTRLAKGEQGPVAPNARIGGSSVDDVAEAILGFDQLKSHLGTFAAQHIAGRPPTKSQALFQRLYMQIRADLQDPSLVGEAFSKFQTVKNASITRAIRQGQLLRSNFARAGSHEAGGQYRFADLIEYDPKKVGAVLDGLADPRGRKDIRDLVSGVTSEVELMETLAKYYPMPPEALATIKAQRQVLESATSKIRAAKELAVKAAEARSLASQTGVFQVVMDGIKGIPYAGTAFASLVGTAKTTVRGLSAAVAALGKGAVKQEDQLAKAVTNTYKHLVEGKAPVAAATRVTKAAAKEPLHLGGLGITSNQVRKAIEEARALQESGSKESAALAAQLEEIRNESPELADAINAKVMAKAGFITSKMPPPDNSDPFKTRPAMVDPMMERSIAKYVSAARDPIGSLDRLANGTGTKEDKETLKVLYPSMYKRFTEQVQERIKNSGKVPPPDKRQLLHFATGIPMAREQRPKYLLDRQKARKQAGPAEPKSDQLKPMVTPSNAKTEFKADQHFASRSDSIISGTDN